MMKRKQTQNPKLNNYRQSNLKIIIFFGSLLRRATLFCRVSPTLYKCELCPKMYILQGAYKTHLKTEHDIGFVKEPIATKPSTKKTKATKPETACQYCFKKYTSPNLLEKHEKVHGEFSFFIFFCRCDLLLFYKSWWVADRLFVRNRIVWFVHWNWCVFNKTALSNLFRNKNNKK